ncbi:MAG TPA: tetratricopeptide repeat protein [Thermoanaerobaculia bacterium]|nr:tetratricopeptide repeat protein [Thermoanaerobaculia bacterium]
MRKILALTTLVIFVFGDAYATCGGGGGGGMGGVTRGGFGPTTTQPADAPPRAYVVPWRILKKEDAPLTNPVIVYWFAATPDEMNTSELVSSRMLTLYSAQCIGMQLVKPDDKETIAKWNVDGKQPVALLVSAGKEVARATADNGALHAADVENMIHHELYLRQVALDEDLASAQKKAESGDRDGAVSAYQRVWEQRCLVPDRGRQAQKALKRLGVTVKDAALRASDPIATAAVNARMTEAMDRALAAEIAGQYERAKTLYIAASKIDPADPVPARFLGELYRHQTGEWTLARQTFDRLLTMQPDPLSRAVALHGIGKMTIHMGDSAKGLELFHASIAAYPLALTYRNLAVYWNSERNRAKADGYVKEALALDPDDPYNLVFAATYMADSGRGEEALRIANANQNLLSASYNLAAIYALLGNKGKAMELLHRHFYTYERYDAVRAKEMWEARVDYVFASLKNDPGFVKLTAMAQ